MTGRAAGIAVVPEATVLAAAPPPALGFQIQADRLQGAAPSGPPFCAYIAAGGANAHPVGATAVVGLLKLWLFVPLSRFLSTMA